MRPDDMDTGDLNGEARPHVQLTGPEQFAQIVGHMLDQRDQAAYERNRTVDQKLDSIGVVLRTLANGVNQLIEDGRQNEAWKRKTDDRLNELEAWRKRVEAAE
jgi:hypothetical protein